ncbi:acyl-CoA dehydrogenase/oxidase [Mycena amicta]|nr:acyl-CoA dehydrogenase/oxidase [Mycena amicta]
MVANKQFTRDEVAQHDKDDDLWVIINGNVYDVSKFAVLHPGGMDVLLDAQTAGQDATEAFFGLHRHEVLLQPQYARLQIATSPTLSRHGSPQDTTPLTSPTSTACSRRLLDGYADALGNGGFISLPPLIQYGKSPVHTKVVNEFLAGKKFVALALSEGFAGSDVSQIKTYAGRTDAGWVVNGTKKWITNGTFATYFTVGCRTEKGMVLLLIEPPSGDPAATAGTAFVTFDNVLVPYENQIEEDGNVLSVILSNFNRERWNMAAATIASHRIIVEECLTWATQRKVFGKPLSTQAVVRSKLAAMITRVESAQAWIESLSYQA